VGQRRAPAGWEHGGYDLRHPHARRGGEPGRDPGAGRRHLDRDAGRGRRRPGREPAARRRGPHRYRAARPSGTAWRSRPTTPCPSSPP
jgi:hypothetical protein